jgi:hypothetical protein
MIGKRLAAVVLAMVLILGVSPRRAASRESEARSVPVVLVHGVTDGGPAVWGRRSQEALGLYGRLLREGYQAGRTLLTYDYSGGVAADYAALALVGLDRVVRQALSAGAGEVDIVTFGSGALVARSWVASHAADKAPLRNLIMLAPPNHGQFQADLLKVLYHTSRLVGGKEAPLSAAGEDFPAPPTFVSEDQFVAGRAREYQGLYSQYVLDCRLLGKAWDDPRPTGGGEAAGPSSVPAPPDYDGWLLASRRDVLESYVFSASAQTPPGAAKSGVTKAYYEILSLRVGRQLYLASAVAGGRSPSPPDLERLISKEWRAEIMAYLKGLLLEWGVPKAKQLWARGRSGAGLRLGELLTCLSPKDVAVSRLVPEYLAFPQPSGAPLFPRPGQRLVLCNAFLHDLQEREERARPIGSRYVTIAGACPSPLGLAAPDLGPNDCVIEAASALTDPYPADGFYLETGLLWAHGLAPFGGRSAQNVLTVLTGRPEAGRLPTGAASLWRPSYREVKAVSGIWSRRPVTVEVRVGDPGATGLDGILARAWLAVVTPAPGQPPRPIGWIDLAPVASTPEGVALAGRLSATPPEPGSRLVLGVRLTPDGAAGPAYLTMGRHLGLEVCLPFAYSVSEEAQEKAAVGGEAEIARPAPPDDEARSAPGEKPETGPGSRSGSRAETSLPGEAEIIPTVKPPLIHVVRVTKLTTDKREDRTYHVRWEWDFGDEGRMVDPDPAHTKVVVEHTYAVPGTYRVAAKSFAADGRLLRDLVWTPQVGSEPVAFEAETIVEPDVTLALEGPAKWVTGRPARFTLKAVVSWPPRTRRQVIRAYPGWTFDVMWEKPGRFEVRAAVTIRQSYEFPDQRITVSNTYVTVVAVEVFTPGITE